MALAIFTSASATDYVVVELGDLTSGATSAGNAINNAGDVIGTVALPDGTYHAFLHTQGQNTDLTPGSNYAEGIHLNIHNESLLYVQPTQESHGTWNFRPFNEPAQPLNDFNEPNSGTVSALNDSRQIIGIRSMQSEPFYRNIPTRVEPTGSITNIGYIGDNQTGGIDLVWATAAGINRHGSVAGTSITTPTGYDLHAYLYADGVVTDLEPIPGVRSGGRSINNSNEVAGNSSFTAEGEDRAAIWKQPGRTLNLNAVSGDSSMATGINNAGEVVGYYRGSDFSPTKPFIIRSRDDSASLLDLNSKSKPSIWELETATGLNDAGQVTGEGQRGNRNVAYIATPFYLQSEFSSDVPATFGSGDRTIKTGCALCSLSALARSVISLAPGSDIVRIITPRTLDADLVRSNGYTTTNQLRWDAIANALRNDATVRFVGSYPTTEDTIDEDLTTQIFENGRRVIIGLTQTQTFPDQPAKVVAPSSHFVWVVGREGNDWKVADPGWSSTAGGEPPPTLTSLQGHIDGFITRSPTTGVRVKRVFAPTSLKVFENTGYTLPGNTPQNRANTDTRLAELSTSSGGAHSLSITLYGDANFVVTDPSGKRTGSISGTLIHEIPGATYFEELPIGSADEDSEITASKATQNCHIPNPVEGQYYIEISGYGAGDADLQWSINGSGGTQKNGGATVDASMGSVSSRQIVVTSPGVADMSVSVTAPASAQVGVIAEYVVSVTNTGPEPATAAQLSVNLPHNTTLSSASGLGACETAYWPQMWCNIESLAVGETKQITINIVPTSVAPISINASVQAFEPDNNNSNNTAKASTDSVSIDFTGWQSAHFTISEILDQSVSGPTADPDGDGIANLMEYALHANPKSNDTSKLPEIGQIDSFDEITGEIRPYLSFKFTKSPAANDITYSVESSDNLTNWSPVESARISEVSMLDGSQKSVLQDNIPMDSVRHRFLRLKVSKRTN